MLQNIGEPDQDGKVDAAQHERIHQLLEIDRARPIFFRVDQNVPVLTNRKITLAPAGDVIEIAGHLRRPSFRRLQHRALAASSFHPASPCVTRCRYLALVPAPSSNMPETTRGS